VGGACAHTVTPPMIGLWPSDHPWINLIDFSP
jgi:hypothetical protein